MAEAPVGDEASTCSAGDNPFDAQTSDRELFPSFEAALADDQSAQETEQQDADSVLDWSIDTLAELKPMAFSPLPQQKDAVNMLGTPLGAIGFFEDEKQYEVLRTPLPAARHVAASATKSKATLTLTPSPSQPLELHRRCRENIAFCEATLWQRQCKMDKLEVVLPPTPKRSSHQRATPPSRSIPSRSAKRYRMSTAVTPNNEPAMRPPKWSASPIAIVGSKQPFCATPATLRFDAMTPSPLVSSSRNTSSKLRLSFGFSPIAFPSPEQAQEEEKIESEEEKSDEDKLSGNSYDDTLPLSSSTAVTESEKEKGDQQAPIDNRQEEGSSSSHGTSTMRTPTAMKSVAPARASIPRRRQQAFMEAMEAEARSSGKEVVFRGEADFEQRQPEAQTQTIASNCCVRVKITSTLSRIADVK